MNEKIHTKEIKQLQNGLPNSTEMKRIKIREDLVSKMEYSKRYNVNRVRVDIMIESGDLSVERISGVDYIVLKKDLILDVQQ